LPRREKRNPSLKEEVVFKTERLLFGSIEEEKKKNRKESLQQMNFNV
jgi:hypothetical protein